MGHRGPSQKTLRVDLWRLRLARRRPPPHRPQSHAAGSGLAPAPLPAREAHRSGGAGSGSSRRRGRRFPQARGESLPRQGAAAAGQPQGRALARQAALRGKRGAGLPAAAYGGYKDVNEAWMAGVLHIGAWPAAAAAGAEGLAVPEDLREAWDERVAIMEADGGVPHAEAERLAWAALQAPRAAR